MSVAYNMAYDVVIKGSRKDIERLAELSVEEYLQQMKAHTDKNNWYYDEKGFENVVREQFSSIKSALSSEADPVILELEYDDDDTSHGYFETFLSVMDKIMPELAIAVYAKSIFEEDSVEIGNALYSPKGGHFSREFDDDFLNDLQFGDAIIDEFPNEDWIPAYWEYGVILSEEYDDEGCYDEESYGDGDSDFEIRNGVLKVYWGTDANVTIPCSVGKIGKEAFDGEDTFCGEGLISVTIPDSVIEIGASAFANCRNLISITMPDSVVKIADSAFEECPNVTIHAPAGSFAEQYAAENGIKFESL